MTTWTTIETCADWPTAICLRGEQPCVSTTYGDAADAGDSYESEHYLDALAAIDRTYGVWCDGDSDHADHGEGDGEEVWYPRVLDVQPTHWLTADGDRVAVLPITDGCEPCDLSNDCGLTTRVEWLSGTGADYSLRGGVLHCNGSAVVGEWSLDPIERE